jgi:hypothetical protein
MSEDRTGTPEPAEQEDELDLDEEFEEPATGEEQDAGEDDGGDEPPSTEPTEPAARTQQRPGRRERQSREIRELRERLDRNERELANARSYQPPPRVDPAEQARRDAQEREQVSLLAPDQQINYWRERDRRDFATALQAQNATVTDQIDRSTWDSACRSDPVRQRMAAQVEQQFRDLGGAGRAPAREVIFTYLYGQEALRQKQRTGGRQRQAAQRRVAGQTTRPAGGRSDVQRDRAAAGDSYEAALQRVQGRPLW